MLSVGRKFQFASKEFKEETSITFDESLFKKEIKTSIVEIKVPLTKNYPNVGAILSQNV